MYMLQGEFPFPILADEDRKLAVSLGMLDEVEKDAAGLPLTARAVFIVGPDKKLKLSILYPATTGRNFEWGLRDSLRERGDWGQWVCRCCSILICRNTRRPTSRPKPIPAFHHGCKSCCKASLMGTDGNRVE